MAYRVREDVGSVLHVHAPFSVAYSRAFEREGELRLEGWELLKGLRGVETHAASIHLPIYPNSQDIEALAREIEPRLDREPQLQAFFLAGHGLYTLGRTVAEAKRHVEVIEAVLEHQHLWRTIRA